MRARSNRPGTSVRFALIDLKDYRIIAKALFGMPVSRLILGLTMEVVTSFAPPQPEGPRLDLNSEGLIRAILEKPRLVEICERVTAREPKLPANEPSQAIWLGFSEEETRTLLEVAKVLDWTQGKLVQQAMRDALGLITFDEKRKSFPVIGRYFRGIKLFEQILEKDLLESVNVYFREWTLNRPVTKPRDDLSQSVRVEIDLAQG